MSAMEIVGAASLVRAMMSQPMSPTTQEATPATSQPHARRAPPGSRLRPSAAHATTASDAPSVVADVARPAGMTPNAAAQHATIVTRVTRVNNAPQRIAVRSSGDNPVHKPTIDNTNEFLLLNIINVGTAIINVGEVPPRLAYDRAPVLVACVGRMCWSANGARGANMDR